MTEWTFLNGRIKVEFENSRWIVIHDGRNCGSVWHTPRFKDIPSHLHDLFLRGRITEKERDDIWKELQERL